MANLSFPGRPFQFDHPRMIEDLLATKIFFDDYGARAGLLPPCSMLERLGDDILNATFLDHGAWNLKRDRILQERLGGLLYAKCFQEGLSVSWLMAAVIFGRKDLRDRFLDGNHRFSLERGMQWLTLHGIAEHKIHGIVSRHFIDELASSSVVLPDGNSASPIELILVGERPDLKMRFGRIGTPGFHEAIWNWLDDTGLRQYQLFWLRKHRIPEK